jgi:hypothetical protein
MVTRRPRALSKRPSEAAVMPFPKELTTPPVTKMYFIGIFDFPPRGYYSTPICLKVKFRSVGQSGGLVVTLSFAHLSFTHLPFYCF